MEKNTIGRKESITAANGLKKIEKSDMSIDVITEAIHEHMNDKRVSSLRKLILTLIVTAEQNTRIFQYHDKNFTEKKVDILRFQ